MEILKFGPDVEVLAPASLREKIVDAVRKIGDVYRFPA